ncbi:MAG: glycogen-debranching protein, partial [Deltaproteobacteria bacterium]|nr:glycogen-debranching protein [Deltaproteobacteria bacterium]
MQGRRADIAGDIAGLKTAPGSPLPLGATVTEAGINFSVFSRHATGMTLVLFEKGKSAPFAEFALDPHVNRTGDIWHVRVTGTGAGLGYGFRADGPFDPKGGYRFKPDAVLLDPYARAVEGGQVWGREPALPWRAYLPADEFDWEGDRPLKIPMKDTIIYELHVRGYTQHDSSGVAHPGTYEGLVEKIPYIKSLGVTAVELLPLFEFNEMENKLTNPRTGKRLKNFWGYSTLAYFAPKASYASNPQGGNAITAFRAMVKAFHRAGLEVILDVVFNHTAESDAKGPTISFRGLDNSVYYCLDQETGDYLNITGCGNTVNCNHPVVREFIIACLRYWVTEMHVDGFRFDLAMVLGRNEKGQWLDEPSLVHAIEQDPVLADTKIIAEPWDAAGYRLGGFPGRWAEWNGFFRDDVRRFIRGDAGMVPALATRIAGSSDLFQGNGRCPWNSINYITCHDGFTLYDLVSYEDKHNEENGEENRDGPSANYSANCGAEGLTDDQEINALRLRRIRTLVTILMVSQGVPMILAGDEFGRTQRGNNNAYCQDNALSWIDWGLAQAHEGLVRFFRKIIALRNRHPA